MVLLFVGIPGDIISISLSAISIVLTIVSLFKGDDRMNVMHVGFNGILGGTKHGVRGAFKHLVGME